MPKGRKKPEENKYGALLADPDVRRWFDNLRRGSEVTADVYLRRLGGFCSSLNTTPKGLLLKSDKELDDAAMDLVTKMEKDGMAGSYIETVIKPAKSWLVFNRRELKANIKIRGARDTPTLVNERVPTQPELKKIFLAAATQARVACAFVSQSGLRLQVLGNYHGDDGLKVGDLPEMEVKDGKVEFPKIPTQVMVRSALSKARHQYFTFLSQEGCEYLKAYLEERIRGGEAISKDSSILRPKSAPNHFIRTINVGDLMRKPMRNAGLPWRPYVLRSYFDSQLMLAESKGKILRDYRAFFMGHKGDIEHTYTLNKHNLPPNILEDMREAYARSQEFLQTGKPEGKSEEETKVSMLKQFLMVVGFTNEELDKMDLLEMDGEEINKMARERWSQKTAKTRGDSAQRLATLDEMEALVKAGWVYVATLPNDKVVMSPPGGSTDGSGLSRS